MGAMLHDAEAQNRRPPTPAVTTQDGLPTNDRDRDFKGFDSLQLGKDPLAPDTTLFQHFTLLDIATLQDFVDTTLDNTLTYALPNVLVLLT